MSDKVAGFDAAAAPLGSDDEAAGRPPSAERIADARVSEGRSRRAAANGAEADLAPDGQNRRWRGAWTGAVGGAIAAVFVVAILAVLFRWG